MLNKKGFIFIETIIVLTITMVCLVSLYSGFNLVIKNIENKKYYDNINDIYKVNIAKKLINNNTSTNQYLDITENNCVYYMDSNCALVFNNLGINHFVITGNDVSKLYDFKDEVFTNSFVKYIKTLDKDSNHVIIIRKEDNRNFYASLKYRSVYEQ